MNKLRVTLLACLIAASTVSVRADGGIPNPSNPCTPSPTQNCATAAPDPSDSWLDMLLDIFGF